MANAFGWTWNSEAHVQTVAKVIDRTGYRLPGIVPR
jgi:hypothetical protein